MMTEMTEMLDGNGNGRLRLSLPTAINPLDTNKQMQAGPSQRLKQRSVGEQTFLVHDSSRTMLLSLISYYNHHNQSSQSIINRGKNTLGRQRSLSSPPEVVTHA